MVLVADTGGDGGGQGGHVWARAFDCVGEVLHDEVEVWEGFGEGDAGVAVGSAKLEILNTDRQYASSSVGMLKDE